MRKKDVIPKQDAIIPLKEATNPLQDAIIPLQEAINPSQEAITPSQEAINPSQEAIIPLQEATNPLQEAIIPLQEAIIPKKKRESKVKPAEKTPVVVLKEPKRKGFTAMFTIDEAEHLEKCIVNRIQNGLCTSASHFIRQCIDYAINAEYFTDKNIEVRFATHEQSEPWQYKLLKDGVFADKRTGLEVCK